MTKHWRKNEEMGVWDPGEKTAVFWEIKTFIIARYRGLMLKLSLKNVIILSICRIGVRMKRNRPERS